MKAPQTKRTLNDISLAGIVQSPRSVRWLVTPDNPHQAGKGLVGATGNGIGADDWWCPMR